MSHIRHTATVITGLLVTVVSLVDAAPAAFAMRLASPDDASGPLVSTSVGTHAGMAGWEITLICVGAALAAAALSAVAVRVRYRTRPRPLAG